MVRPTQFTQGRGDLQVSIYPQAALTLTTILQSQPPGCQIALEFSASAAGESESALRLLEVQAPDRERCYEASARTRSPSLRLRGTGFRLPEPVV